VDKVNDSFYAAMKNVMISAFIAEAPGYTEEEAAEYMEAYLGVSSLDDYIRENMDGFVYEELKEDVNKAGQFKVVDNRIYFTTSTDTVVDVNKGESYTFEEISSTEITINDLDFIEKDASLDFKLTK